MIATETLPGLYRQTKPERLERIEIPLGWVRSVEFLRPFASNLTMLLGTSGTGRDTLLDAIRALDPAYDRVMRTTTRPYRNPDEDARIISIDENKFMQGVLANRIVCPFLYPANAQRYGIPIEELSKLQKGTVLLEGTSELIPLKTLLPQAWLFVIVPESLAQLRSQLNGRDGTQNPETKGRIRQATRELTILLSRLPSLVSDRIVDGVIINSPPIETAAAQALQQIQGQTKQTSIPSQLAEDIKSYLSLWRSS